MPYFLSCIIAVWILLWIDCTNYNSYCKSRKFSCPSLLLPDWVICILFWGNIIGMIVYSYVATYLHRFI